MLRQIRHLMALILLTITLNAYSASNSAVILIYHHIGDERYPTTNIQINQFEAHLDFLEQEGFSVWPLDRVINSLKNDTPLPSKTIVITMDDAYKSIYTQAYPRLKARNWPFTVFVSTDYIDKEYSNYMTWQQMQEMEKHGATFGNHSRSHISFIEKKSNETDRAWRNRINEEIDFAAKRLNEELSNTIPYLAYPYGEYNLAAADIVAEKNLIGLGQHSGAIGKNSDMRFLPRFPMSETYGTMDEFKNKVLSLPMPFANPLVIEPVTHEPRPVLSTTLKTPVKEISCFASRQGKITVSRKNEFEFSAQAEQEIPIGRSRYNCTAPSSILDRYYWFSQPWIRTH